MWVEYINSRHRVFTQKKAYKTLLLSTSPPVYYSVITLAVATIQSRHWQRLQVHHKTSSLYCSQSQIAKSLWGFNDRGIGIQFPTGTRNLFYEVPDWFRCTPSLTLNGFGTALPGVNSARSLKLTICLHPVQNIRTGRTMLPLSPCLRGARYIKVHQGTSSTGPTFFFWFGRNISKSEYQFRHVCPSVCPHGTSGLLRDESLWNLKICRKCVQNIQVELKLDKSAGCFTWTFTCAFTWIFTCAFTWAFKIFWRITVTIRNVWDKNRR